MPVYYNLFRGEREEVTAVMYGSLFSMGESDGETHWQFCDQIIENIAVIY